MIADWLVHVGESISQQKHGQMWHDLGYAIPFKYNASPATEGNTVPVYRLATYWGIPRQW
jgi:hypothetical protein